MTATFTRMKAQAKNMVCQYNDDRSFDLLCVECGWEYKSFCVTAAPWVAFMNHPCRLTTTTVSTSDF